MAVRKPAHGMKAAVEFLAEIGAPGLSISEGPHSGEQVC